MAPKQAQPLILGYLGGDGGVGLPRAAEQLAGLESRAWLISKVLVCLAWPFDDLAPLGLFMRAGNISIQ